MYKGDINSESGLKEIGEFYENYPLIVMSTNYQYKSEVYYKINDFTDDKIYPWTVWIKKSEFEEKKSEEFGKIFELKHNFDENHSKSSSDKISSGFYLLHEAKLQKFNANYYILNIKIEESEIKNNLLSQFKGLNSEIFLYHFGIGSKLDNRLEIRFIESDFRYFDRKQVNGHLFCIPVKGKYRPIFEKIICDVENELIKKCEFGSKLFNVSFDKNIKLLF
jgi:hypothetical protein